MIKKRAAPTRTSAAQRQAAPMAPLDVTTRDIKGRTPLHLAAFFGYSVIARKLLLQQADANARDDDQRTPGHWSAFKGHLEITQLLVENGADVNARDSGGRTLLRMAIIGQQSASEALLRVHGAVL